MHDELIDLVDECDQVQCVQWRSRVNEYPHLHVRAVLAFLIDPEFTICYTLLNDFIYE
jgi:hypothetical protein